MGARPEQVPPIPVDLTMPVTPQLVVTVGVGVLVAAAVGFAVVHAVRQRSAAFPALLLGAALAVVNEPVLNMLGGLWHPRHGQWTLFETFDRPMPVWAAGGYLLYFGATPAVISVILRSGATRGRFYATIAVIFAADLAIELPVVGSGVYVYYGYQPYTLFGILPAEWLFINGMAVGGTAMVLHHLPGLYSGRRWPVLVALPCVTQYAGWSVGIPFFAAYNSDLGHPLTWVAATVTMLLGAAAFVALGRTVPDAATSVPDAPAMVRTP